MNGDAGSVAVPLRDVFAARRRIAGAIRATPLVRAPWIESRDPVYLKLESLQATGSFKLRGALNAIRRLCEGGARPSIVTASAGNHGKAVAHAAALAGLRPTVFTPRTAPAAKLDAIRSSGAVLVADAPDYDTAESAGREFARRNGATFVSPYSDRDVIAGAATIALDIIEDVPDVRRILVPLGGGGLLSGIASVAASVHRDIAVIGVESAASPGFTAALAAGRVVPVEVGDTIADGLAGNFDPDTITFDIVRRHVHRVVTVSDDVIYRAMACLARTEHVIVEGAGAAAVAALLDRAELRSPGPTVAIVSGANIDLERWEGVTRQAWNSEEQ
jgi:threonine dehydratase